MGDKPFDQLVDTAWEQFATRLTDRLATSDPVDSAWRVVTGSGNAFADLVTVMPRERDCQVQVELPPHHDDATSRLLRRCGLRVRSSGARGRYRDCEDAAMAVVVALRDVWGLPHPCFAEPVGSAALWASPERDVRTEIIRAIGSGFSTVDVADVDRVVALRHAGGQIVVIRFEESRGTAEAHVLLASGASEPAALAVATGLGAEFPELEFRFSSGHLLAVHTFGIDPLYPPDVRDAVIELVELAMAQGPEIRARLVAPPSDGAGNDPRLATLVGHCTTVDSQEAVEQALVLSERSADLLRTWYREAVEARGAAVARRDVRQELTWTTVSGVVAVALARLTIGTA